jgi:hypothetical protein
VSDPGQSAGNDGNRREEESGALVRTAARGLSWEEVKALVLDAVASPHSKRAYARALAAFAQWAHGLEAGQGSASPFSKALVQRYRVFSKRKASPPLR